MVKGLFNAFGRRGSETSGQGREGIPWQPLVGEAQWEGLLQQSHSTPQVIFKHSKRCGFSAMVLRRFEARWSGLAYPVGFHFLDVIAHRDLSSHIARHFGLRHESPQVLVVDKGKLLASASHGAVPDLAIPQE
ncbi:bacillithiol system redox-active protein YtxJ [Robiginitalea sediminis]|uniref:bacillithiol system redox-active protein YtxJ n=1 Tax=Robiginitalea sediminis TaxID=1982593 RepID=UPI001303B231|nr:bacillithiol system redox-active protein YtxJ [Robiginitalea sediminis]